MNTDGAGKMGLRTFWLNKCTLAIQRDFSFANFFDCSQQCNIGGTNWI